MKEKSHPNSSIIRFYCSCGNEFHISSTLNKKEMEVDICSKCHPFYTGQQKLVDTAGRVEKFMDRYKMPK